MYNTDKFLGNNFPSLLIQTSLVGLILFYCGQISTMGLKYSAIETNSSKKYTEIIANDSEISQSKTYKRIAEKERINSTKAVKKYEPKNALELTYVRAKTLDLVKEFEGFSSSAYIDTDGTAVIGYGMSKINGRKVTMKDIISQSDAEAALKKELEKIQEQILTIVKVELNENQLTALTSFVFNVGIEQFKNSTLLKKLNKGDYKSAGNEFPRWNKANRGKRLVPLAGLTRRRLAEREIFISIN